MKGKESLRGRWERLDRKESEKWEEGDGEEDLRVSEGEDGQSCVMGQRLTEVDWTLLALNIN